MKTKTDPVRITMPMTSSPSLPRTLGIFIFFAFASLIGGAVLGILVVQWGMAQDVGWLFSLIEQGDGPTVVRRIQTLTAIALAPWLLKQIGWRGFSDLGWRAEKRDIWISVAEGYVIGVISMGILTALAFAADVRIFQPDKVPHLWLEVAAGVLITGIGVGIVEDVMARGVLFRSLARSTTPWLACLLTSILFSYAHFAEIEFPAVFEEGIGPAVLASLQGEFVLEQNAHIVLEFINLAMLGIVFCRMVSLKGHIWLAVGFHASAVGMIKTISILTNVNWDTPRNLWVGTNSGYLDGWACLVFLGLLLGIVEFRIFRKDQNQQEQKASSEL
jgi:membrane protease YdiL (CAAX protease family)